MKVLCVLNPLAAGGLAVQRWPNVAALMDAFGIEYELLSEEAIPIPQQVGGCLARRGADAFAAIASVGGDGTHSAVINAVMEYKRGHPTADLPPCGFVPLGTGNDIAKSFGLSSREDFFVNDLRRAVSTIVYGADYELDLGVLNGVYFADALTIGLDSRILHERNIHKERIQRIPGIRVLSRGRFLYTLCTGVMFWRQRQIEADITVDGKSWYSGPMINLVINNTRIYAGEFDFSSDAYANDGRLDVVLFTGHTDYLRRYLLAIRHNPDRIREFSDRLHRMSSHIQGREIQVRLAEPESAQMDGEEIPAADAFCVSVVPKALRIKTPAEPA